jgi:hypothetical protein
MSRKSKHLMYKKTEPLMGRCANATQARNVKQIGLEQFKAFL